MKSLVILAIWLALSAAIYSRIALSFALNRIFFWANDNGTVKQNNQSDFKVSFKVINKISGRLLAKSHCGEFGTTVVKTLLLLFFCFVFFFKKIDELYLFYYSFWMTMIMSSFRLKTYFNGSFQVTFSVHFDEYFGDFSSISS